MSFSSWCFLCASDSNVTTEIQSLDVSMKETIGMFSLLNFTLQGVPSNICKLCHNFLKDYEWRKSLYSQAEQMFMELLRTKNRSTDLKAIRAKYNIDGQNKLPVQNSTSSYEPHEYFEDDTATPPSPVRKTKQQTTRSVTVEIQTILPKKVPVKPNLVTLQTVSPPKLLNPTIPTPTVITNSRLNILHCDLCTHTSSTKLSMERHIQNIHLQTNPKVFRCEICLKVFAQKSVLLNHQKTHLDDQQPSWECPECGKILSSQAVVANHIKRVHKGLREFECEVCKKNFATKGSMKEHQKIHSDVKDHTCPICNKSYKTASTLTQHMDTHGETEYHCPQCNLRLNSKRTLRQHMLRHSDVKKFTCEICQAQFKRQKPYKEHIVSVHAKLRAYKCDWCDKTFSNGANCRKHKKTVHPKELQEADENQEKKSVKLPKVEELYEMSVE